MLPLLLSDRFRGKCGRSPVHVVFGEYAMLDAIVRETDAERQKVIATRNGDENQIGAFAADKIASGSDASVTGLDGLMRERHVLADDDIDVFNLQHDQTPKRGCFQLEGDCSRFDYERQIKAPGRAVSGRRSGRSRRWPGVYGGPELGGWL
jgi:hypothetical protein